MSSAESKVDMVKGMMLMEVVNVGGAAGRGRDVEDEGCGNGRFGVGRCLEHVSGG